MTILALVASHQTVDLTTVAHLANGAQGIPETAAHSGLAGVVVLSTCNRLELYAEVATVEGATEELRMTAIAEASAVLFHAISARSGLSYDIVSESFTLRQDTSAAQHLFTVASGLESAVVGEREINGQVRRAIAMAQEEGHASGNLVRLFNTAAATARQVGRQTLLGSRGRSVVSVALDLANEVAAKDWSERKVLIFGTGSYAGAAVAALHARGCSNIGVFSRSQRAAIFADKRGITPVYSEDLMKQMKDADIIIGCSGSSEPMPADHIPAGKHVILDLALSHDFAPDVADLPQIDLITLESVRLAAPEETVESVETARQIVDSATRDFESKQKARNVDAAIVALRQHTLTVLDTELEKVRNQYGCGAATDQVEFALRRMVKSLLHTPTVRARSLAKDGREGDYVAALEALYGIEIEQEIPSHTSGCPQADAS